MYNKGILLKAKFYIVLVSKFEKTTTLNKQQERALWTFMSRKDDFANWVWKISRFAGLWPAGFSKRVASGTQGILPLKKNHSTGFENLGYFLKFIKKTFLRRIIHNTFYI